MLTDMAHRSEEENARMTAYTALGRLNQTDVIPEIIAFVVGNSGLPSDRYNAINWLQGFSDAEQVKALQEIIARAQDPDVVRYARMRLDSRLQAAGSKIDLPVSQ